MIILQHVYKIIMSKYFFLFEQKKARNDAAYIVSIITSEGNILSNNLSNEYNKGFLFNMLTLLL